ncbi:hypothetical protein J6X73_02920, partial [Candidatus Saccharibacteria bacterium]|nr:hypothetical protein [Candidatus Saccharibacteria bacterium]
KEAQEKAEKDAKAAKEAQEKAEKDAKAAKEAQEKAGGGIDAGATAEILTRLKNIQTLVSLPESARQSVLDAQRNATAFGSINLV